MSLLLQQNAKNVETNEPAHEALGEFVSLP